MGWEFRIFFRSERSTPRVLNLSGKAGERTDVYYVHSPTVGVKKRGGGGLEVKLMKDKDADGFEKWEKLKTSEDELENLLSESNYKPMPVDAPPITLIKRRVQTNFGFKILEETDLILCFSDIKTGPVQEYWRTICIEGKRKSCLPQQQQLYSQVKELVPDSEIIVCGYPYFIAHSIGRLWNDPSAPKFLKNSSYPPPPSKPPPIGGAEESMMGCGFDVLLGTPMCKPATPTKNDETPNC